MRWYEERREMSTASESGVPPLGANELRERVEAHRASLLERMAAGEDGLSLGDKNARFLDELMAQSFVVAARASGVGENGIALAAVGSFGRGAVALRSDADVRLVCGTGRRDRDRAAKLAEALLYPLWDAKLSIGHQVEDAGELLSLAQRDLATATSLLDLRPLAGDEAIVRGTLDRAYAGIFAEGELASFLDRLEQEATARHARYGESVYLLEPDVKGGAGGLRDLDGARWAAQARFRVSSRGAATWNELVRLGVLVPREAKELTAAEEFLWRVRNRLHAHAERRSDRLTFEEQESIAIELKSYGDDRVTAAERFMQDYYLYARVVSSSRARLLERARPPRRRGKPTEVDVGRGVRLFDGQVTIAGAQELAADPTLALRVYAACVRHGAPVLAYAREAIARAAADPAWCEALRASKEAGRLFVDLVCTVPETKSRRGSIVAELHDVGLLLAMIPEFRPVTGRVHHDVYHVYTVDVHSVAALDCLRALCRGELAHEYPLACRLAAEIAKPEPLFIATLLHDVGKGYPDSTGSRKNHSQSGAELCATILPRLGFDDDDAQESRALVAQHLAMYHAATRRDLDDPATIEEFARSLRGREGLRDLYLLTVADITTTSPTAMTTWKARMLDELYFASDAYLAGRTDRDLETERKEHIVVAAQAAWRGAPDFLRGFVDSMPERYLLANAPDAIVAHAGVALDRGSAAVHAAITPPRLTDRGSGGKNADGFSEICVVAEDKPGLLARIAATITASRLEVLAAQVYSRTTTASRGPRSGGAGDVPSGVEAVDLFWVRDRDGGEAGVAQALPRLVRDLADVCEGRVDPEELLRMRTGSTSPWRERPSPAVLTEVVVDDRASPRHTVVEVYAKDRPGLLYTLAHALHELGLSIALSKINTEGTKVADVFYVSELDGSKVKTQERAKQIREALTRAVG
jgi:[protein-PII] uridylyltransferase